MATAVSWWLRRNLKKVLMAPPAALPRYNHTFLKFTFHLHVNTAVFWEKCLKVKHSQYWRRPHMYQSVIEIHTVTQHRVWPEQPAGNGEWPGLWHGRMFPSARNCYLPPSPIFLSLLSSYNRRKLDQKDFTFTPWLLSPPNLDFYCSDDYQSKASRPSRPAQTSCFQLLELFYIWSVGMTHVPSHMCTSSALRLDFRENNTILWSLFLCSLTVLFMLSSVCAFCDMLAVNVAQRWEF